MLQPYLLFPPPTWLCLFYLLALNTCYLFSVYLLSKRYSILPLYAGQEATEPDMEQQTGCKLGKSCLKLNIQKTKIMASGPKTSWQIDGETMETVREFIFLDFKVTADGDCSHEVKRCLLLGRKAMTNLDSILKSRDIADKDPSSQSYGFSSSHVWMWELDYKESWALQNWWFWTVVLEKTLENPLDCKIIKPVNPKGNQSWIFIGRTDAKSETPILWPPDVKNWLIGKDPDAGKDWRKEDKGMTEDELVGWHRWLDGHEFEQIPGVGDGQGNLVRCSPWGCKELEMTEWLNWFIFAGSFCIISMWYI